MIDTEELVAMLNSLGVYPSDLDVQNMLEDVDGAADGQKDGKVNLREFLLWYARGVRNSQRDTVKEDVTDAYRKLGGTKESLPKADLRIYLSQEYGLEYTTEEITIMFGASEDGADLSIDDFMTTLTQPNEALLT